MRLRVLQVIAPGGQGGAENVSAYLAYGLNQHGHESHVLALLEQGSESSTHPYVTLLTRHGVSPRIISVPHRSYLRQWLMVRDAIRILAPDIVHTHGYLADVIAGTAGRAAGARVVSTAHGFTGGGWRGQFYEKLQRRAFTKCDAVVAVSQKLCDDLIRRQRDPGTVNIIQNVLPPAHDTLSRLEARRLLNLPETGPTVGWVGRLSPEKAPDHFVEAMQQTNLSSVGCLLGDGPMRPILEEMIREGTGSIKLCDAVPNARRLMPAFDVIVLSSRTEGTPLVLLEAIDAGVPVVATRVGGVPDLLDDDSGLLVESGDVTGLRQAITDVIQNPERAAERARHARRTLQALYDFETWVNRHEELYRKVIPVRHTPDASQSSGGS